MIKKILFQWRNTLSLKGQINTKGLLTRPIVRSQYLSPLGLRTRARACASVCSPTDLLWFTVKAVNPYHFHQLGSYKAWKFLLFIKIHLLQWSYKSLAILTFKMLKDFLVFWICRHAYLKKVAWFVGLMFFSHLFLR